MFRSTDPKVRAMQAEIKAQLEETKKTEFEEFMDMAHVRFMMSLVPQPENPDTLRSLLRTAFEQGFQGGASATMVMLMEKTLNQLEEVYKKHGGQGQHGP